MPGGKTSCNAISNYKNRSARARAEKNEEKVSSSFVFFFFFGSLERVDYDFFVERGEYEKHSPIPEFRTSTSAFSCVPTRFVLKVKFTHKAR